MLSDFPKVEFGGAKAHKISRKIYHLMRGEIYYIENQRFFTLGGASSHDKEYRKEGHSWWKEELPSTQELENATKSLEATGWCVDYVITHCAPSSLQSLLRPDYKADALTDYLEGIKARLSYKKWFFGHYHTDLTIDKKHYALYQSIFPLEL